MPRMVRRGKLMATKYEVREIVPERFHPVLTLGDFDTLEEAQKVAKEYEKKYLPVNPNYRTEIWSYESTGY